MLASRYHPDNPISGNMETFLLLQQAYDVLVDPDKRSVYDAGYQKQGVQPVSVFEMKDFVVGIEAEVNRRLGMLCLLYNRCRSDPDRAGISMFDLEVMMSLPR